MISNHLIIKNFQICGYDFMKIAVVIPCYKSKKKIISVIKKIKKSIYKIVVVDDFCPEKTGNYVQSKIKDKRVSVIFNKKNLGVGGAVIEGFKFLKNYKIDVIVKLDSDGQMNPENINDLVNPISSSNADFVKGNRLYSYENIIKMPRIRLLGNVVLTYLTKFTSGYYKSADPTNGFFAIKKNLLNKINLDKLSKNYFFETSLLFNLYLLKAKISHYEMKTIYFKNSTSSLSIPKIIPLFLKEHFFFLIKRIVSNKNHRLLFLFQILIISFLKIFFKIYFFFYFIPILVIIFFLIDIRNEPA